MSTLSRRLAKLEGASAHRGRYAVASWADYYAVSRRFLDYRGLYVRLTEEEAERRARQREDPTLPPEERLTYAEAVAEGVVHETPAFQRARAEGDPSHRSIYLRER